MMVVYAAVVGVGCFYQWCIDGYPTLLARTTSMACMHTMAWFMLPALCTTGCLVGYV
jgi:hypothetical protein